MELSKNGYATNQKAGRKAKGEQMTKFYSQQYLNTVSCQTGNKFHNIGKIILFNENGPASECTNAWPVLYKGSSNNPFHTFEIPCDVPFKRLPDFSLSAFIIHVGPDYQGAPADGLFLNPEKLGMKLHQEVSSGAYIRNIYTVEWNADEKKQVFYFSSLAAFIDRPIHAAQHNIVEIIDFLKANTYRPYDLEVQGMAKKLENAFKEYNTAKKEVEQNVNVANELISKGNIIPSDLEILERLKKYALIGKKQQ